jgi:hypothetical protein
MSISFHKEQITLFGQATSQAAQASSGRSAGFETSLKYTSASLAISGFIQERLVFDLLVHHFMKSDT